MSCQVCDSLPLRQLRELDNEVRSGTTTLLDLATKYGVDQDVLRAHAAKCVDLETIDGFLQLENATKQLRTIGAALKLDIDNGVHQQFDPEGGVDGRGTIGNFIAVQREMRENILAMKRLRSTDDTTKILTQDIINPIVNQLTLICIEEVGRLREAVFKLTEEGQHGRLKNMIDDALLRIGTRLKTDATHDLGKRIDAVLSSKVVAH